jgi:hypothetical protein
MLLMCSKDKGVYHHQSVMGAEIVNILANIRQNLHSDGFLPFPRILGECLWRKASNPKDKIYGLLGLTSKNNNVPINYHCVFSVGAIYEQVARYLIQTGQYFEVISLAGVGFDRNVNGVPSWVPDWSSENDVTPLGFPYSYLGSNYQASGGEQAFIEESTDQKVLKVWGKTLDHIECLGEEFPVALLDELGVYHSSGESQKILRWYKETELMIMKIGKDRDIEFYPHIEAELSRESLWRTLIGNRTLEKRPAPGIYGSYFDVWENGQIKYPELDRGLLDNVDHHVMTACT